MDYLLKKFQIKIFDERYYNVPEENRNYTIVADDLINSGKIQDCKIEQSENIKVTPDKRYIKVSDNYIWVIQI